MSHLHVDSIQKSFNGKQILTDIYLSCSTGEIVGLLGRNGTGKSTLLKIISGSLRADFKHVKVDDQVMLKTKDHKNRITYLAQDQLIPSHIHVDLAIKLYCKPEKAKLILKNALVQRLLGKKPFELSSGELRYIEIMIVLFSEASFCLLDEPFKGIAPLYKEKISALIVEQSKLKGIVVSDHDYRNVLKVTHRNYILNDGGIYEVKNEEELRAWNYLP